MSSKRVRDGGAMIAILGVALSVLLAASPAQATNSRGLLQSMGDFPPNCTCQRDASSSPFTLTLGDLPSAATQGLYKYCFRLERVGGCERTAQCCSSNSGVNKIEIAANLDCKGILRRVTVDGRNHSALEFNKYGVVRITSLNLTAADFDDATHSICLFLRVNDTCGKLESFCTLNDTACLYAIFHTDRRCCPVAITPPLSPSTPIQPASVRPPPLPHAVPNVVYPPPAPSFFPNCSCNRNASGSQLFVHKTYTITPAERNLTKICFTVGAASLCEDPDSECCIFMLSKVEFDADPACATALVYMSVDNVIRPRFFQYTPYPMIKVTAINRPFNAVNGTEVCLYMRSWCNTLEALSKSKDGSMTVAIFNPPSEKINCCPTFTIP